MISATGKTIEVRLKNRGVEDIKYKSIIATAEIKSGQKIRYSEVSNVNTSLTKTEVPGYAVVFRGEERVLDFEVLPENKSIYLDPAHFEEFEMPGFSNQEKEFTLKCHLER